jgi:hypothetical protein
MKRGGSRARLGVRAIEELLKSSNLLAPGCKGAETEPYFCVLNVLAPGALSSSFGVENQSGNAKANCNQADGNRGIVGKPQRDAG